MTDGRLIFELLSSFQIPWHFRIISVGHVLQCKVTAAGHERQGPLMLRVGGQSRQPSAIFPSSKLGIPSLSSHSTLVFSTLLPQCGMHVKRYSRPRSSTELYKREKNWNSNISKHSDYESKENDNRGGKEAWHQPFPQLPQHRLGAGDEETVLWCWLPSGTMWQLHI